MCNEFVTYPPRWEDERGFLKTAQCAVLPREMSLRIRKAQAVPEAVVILCNRRERSLPDFKNKQSVYYGLFIFCTWHRCIFADLNPRRIGATPREPNGDALRKIFNFRKKYLGFILLYISKNSVMFVIF